MLRTSTDGIEDVKETVVAACAEWLLRERYREIAEQLPEPEICFHEFCRIGTAFALEWVNRLAGQGFDASEIGRCVLIRAVSSAVRLVDGQRVSERVKRLLLEDFLRYTDPPARWLPMFEPATVRYQEMVKLLTFQRFPAGQFQWETSGIPFTFIRSAGPGGGVRLAACLLGLGGRKPLWDFHLNDRRPNAFLLSERSALKSYYRMAKSLEMQSEVLGIMTASWLYSKEVAAVSPHLAWLRRHFEENGATVVDLGRAPADSGFLTGDAQRKALYESGAFHPRVTAVVWPRSDAIAWAHRNSELED